MNNFGKALKMERLELNEGSKHAQGALAIGFISTNLGNVFTPQSSYKSEKRMVSTKDVANV
jgi:hypothetical protein